MSAATPNYGNPPLAEVSCGITFTPLTISRLQLGVFWSQLRSEYPKIEEAEPLPTIVEGFDVDTTVEFRDQWRELLTHTDDDRVIQIQRDRLSFNWRKGKHDKEYPHFTTVLDGFREHCSRFENFALAELGNPIEPAQYEVSYINHIPEDDGAFRDAAGLIGLLPDLAWRAGQRFLPKPERVDHRVSFVLPDKSGRMHARAYYARRRTDLAPLLVIELTVRGMANDRWQWFQTAHDWIVLGFEDLTSVEVQKSIWQKK